jgi:hypothetical protein
MKNKSKLVQQTIMARKNVRNLAVTLLPGDKCEIINMNTLNSPSLTREKAVEVMRDMTEVKHNWSVLLFVCGRCPTGGSYWKTRDVAPPGKFYSSQINKSLRHHHDKMINDFNKQQFVSLGWIARPVDALYDNDAMYDLFMKLGAWEFLAPWEVEK